MSLLLISLLRGWTMEAINHKSITVLELTFIAAPADN